MNGYGWFRRIATVWLVLLTMGHSSQASGWSKSFDGDNAPNAAQRVAALPGGDVVAYASTGRYYYPGGYDELNKIIRFSGASGEEVWRSPVPLGETTGEFMVTPGGDLYSATFHGAVSRHRATDGVRLWSSSVAGTCSGYNTFTWNGGLAAHPLGDVVVGATGCVGGGSNAATFTVGRLNGSDGSVVWRTQVESQPPGSQQPSGSSLAVAADAAGDVVAVGELAFSGPPQGRQFALVKFDGESGQELWRFALSGTNDSRATAVAIDAQDNVVVAGTVSGVFTVCKFSPTGLPLWNTFPITSEPIGCRQQFFFNDPDRVFRTGSALLAAVDENNNVIVGGNADFVCTGRSLLLMKLAAFDGSPMWSGLNPGQPTCPSFATRLTTPGSAARMVVGAAGDIAIVGTQYSTWAAKVAGDTGVELWSKPFPRVGGVQDVALDEAGHVLVAGSDTSRGCTQSDVLVAKLRGSDGAIAPSCGDHVEDVDEECDDGDTDDNDGCSADCTVEHGCCGDGVAFGVGEECDDGNTNDGDGCSASCEDEYLADPVHTLRPVVYLHPDETNLPADPLEFIWRSRLKWNHGGLCRLHTVGPRHPRPDKLGEGRYRHRATQIVGNRCRHSRDRWWTSAENTRPFGLLGEDGFFLDLLDDGYRIGDTARAPIAYLYEPGRYVIYWFFYAYNTAPYGPGGVTLDHEGDWEHIAIKLDSVTNRPQEIHLSQHEGGEDLTWAEISHSERWRPIVYAALGSHALYRQGGLHPIYHSPDPLPAAYDNTDVGPRWDTYELINLKDQPWWGYGGAWGEAGSELTAGPAGPHPLFKTGIPAGW